MRLTWRGALAWRMGRQLLDPVGDVPVAGVVGRLCAVGAKSEDAAELAIRTRRARSRPGEVAQALDSGRIIKTYAFRGATHLMTPQDAGSYLALRSASRMWELPSWQEFYGLAPDDWPALREAVRDALADGPLTRAELGAAVTDVRRFRHLHFAFADDAGTLLKPLTWHGVMSFGPTRDGKATFQRLDTNPRWAGLPELDDAGRHAIRSYLRAYGPATTEHVQHWLGDGLSAGRRRIDGWLAGLRDELAELTIDGQTAYVLADDLDELASTRASTAVRLLPGHDQWVLGPGTADRHVVPPEKRSRVTRGDNLVISGGSVAGTWRSKDDRLQVTWFAGSGRIPRRALSAEVDRLAGILARPLEAVVEPAHPA